MATNDPTTGMPPMIGRGLPRADWLTYIASYDFGAQPPTRVVLHHTWVPTVAQWSGQRSMQALQRFYAGKGWPAAPHLFVGPDAIWLFTPLKDVGVHAGIGNSGTSNGHFWYSIGVEMVGDYDRVLPSGAVWENTKAVLGGLSKRLKIAPSQLISFHRDYTNQKSCPGWAVTKEWVSREIDAWLSNSPAPPAPKPGPIGSPAPDVEALNEALLDQSYARRGEGYNSEWAFHQYAAQGGLGFPIGKSALLQSGGKSYAYQPFAHDTLYNEVPNWGDVRRLSTLLGGKIEIAADGLGRQLLEASYRAGGATLHPDWAFHQSAIAQQLGPPIGESATITVDGAQYSYQAFALDTLYNLVPNWGDVKRLSGLARASAAAQIRLRDALLLQTYRAAGASYHSDWAFHQLARQWNIGAALSDSYRIAVGAAQYAIQVYATDTLYNLVPNWSDVRRLSALLAPAILGAAHERIEQPQIAAGAQREPAPAPFHILQYAPASAMPTAYSDRDGARIALLVLHSDPGPAEQSIAAMAAPGAAASAHYYVSSAGLIYQLIDDRHAAWHAGMADWRGRRQNINRVSLGLVAEQGASGYTAALLDALVWLVDTLRGRYQLPSDALLRWGTLNPQRSADPAGFPWDLLLQRLVPGIPAPVEQR